MTCPACGYMMTAFDKICPRCKKLGRPPASDQPGTDGSGRMPNAAQWEALHARTGDSLDAARAVIKDAGNVVLWSRLLGEKIQQRKKDAQEKEEAQRKEAQGTSVRQPENGGTLEAPAASEPFATPELNPTPEPNAFSLVSGGTVLVICWERDLDLTTSPLLENLLSSLAVDPEATGQARLYPVQADRDEADQGRTNQRKTDRGQGRESEHRRRENQEAQRQQPVVVDLRGTHLVDISGLAALIQGRKVLNDHDLQLMVLLRPGSQPEHAFIAYGLGKIITPIYSLDAL